MSESELNTSADSSKTIQMDGPSSGEEQCDALGLPVSTVADYGLLAGQYVEEAHKILIGKVTASDKKRLVGVLGKLTEVIRKQSVELGEARAMLGHATVRTVALESQLEKAEMPKSYVEAAKEGDRKGRDKPEEDQDESKKAKTSEHVLIVFPKKGAKKDAKALSSEMRSAIRDPKEIGIGVQWTRPLQNGGVLVRVDTPKDLGALTEALKSHKTLGEMVEIHVPRKRSPRIIVYDVPNGCQAEEVVTVLAEQAKVDPATLTSKFSVKRGDTNHWVLEADPSSFATIKKVGSFKFGWQCVRVGEHIRPTQCYKCGGYGHIAKGCLAAECCLRCSRPGHRAKDCKSKKYCNNCKNLSKISKQKVETSHTMLDLHCPSRKVEKELIAKRTNYG